MRWLGRLADPTDQLGAGGHLLVLFGLTGFAFTQPLLALLGEEPTWFTSRGASRTQIVAFALIVALACPLLLWAVGRALHGLSHRLGRIYFIAVVAGLASVALLRVLQSVDAAPASVAIIAATCAGLGFAAGFCASPSIRVWTQYTCVLPVVAVAAFLLASPTGELVRASSHEVTQSSGSDAPSVLFIMLDELPTLALLDADGDIDEVRFPNLAALADDGAWYPSYSSSSGYTSTAVPSILSGKAPTDDPPIYTRHPDNLFSLLAPTHVLHVAETATELCDPSACPSSLGSRSSGSILRDLLVDGGAALGERLSGGSPSDAFDDFEPELRATIQDRVMDEWSHVRQRPEELNNLLPTIQEVDEPTFWFAHLMLPHRPWLLYPDGREYDRFGYAEEKVVDDDWTRAIAEQRLLLQLQYTDALVGEALDALRRSGGYDDTIVVVTADHGVSLTSGRDRRSVTRKTIDQIAYVPLIIKGPGGEQPMPDGSNVVSADLLPTIAALVGVDVPWEVEGHPIGSDAQRRRGPAKEIYDFGSEARPAYQRTLEFDGPERAPTFDARRVGSLRAGDGPIAGLLDPFEVDPWLGRSIDEQADGTVFGAARLTGGAARFRDPGATPPGIVVATLVGDHHADDLVLMEVNGVIVTAAPINESGGGGSAHAFLMFPPGAFEASGNEIEIALLRDGHVLRLSQG